MPSKCWCTVTLQPARTGAPAHRFDLQAEILNADRVVAIYRALELQGEDEIQIPAATWQERVSRLRCCHLKAAIELGDIVPSQKRIRRVQGRDPGQPQFLRQPSLPSAEVAFTAAPRLRPEAGIIWMSSSRKARPTWVRRCTSTFPPTFGVSQKWLPGSL